MNYNYYFYAISLTDKLNKEAAKDKISRSVSLSLKDS